MDQKISDDYVAGLFDGEGWFSISRAAGHHYGAKRDWAYQLHAAMTLKERVVLSCLRSRWGGTVVEQKNRSKNHARYFRWQVTGESAREFAEDIGPKMIIKKARAGLAVEFQLDKGQKGNKPSSDREYDKQTKMYEQMKKLNKRGPNVVE